jgi:predicted acetyltransferase
MADFEVRTLGPDDVEAALMLRANAFGNSVTDTQRGVVQSRFERGGSFGIDVDGRVAGMLTVHPLGQFFGGRSVPMGGVASVAVSVEYRGRGIAPALVTAAVTTMRDAGQVVSSLHPATTGFYRRLGWELAGAFPVSSLPARSLAALPPGEPDRLRRAGTDDLPLLRDAYARAAPARAGWIERPDWFWDNAYDGGADGSSVIVCDAAEGDGIDGFALYEQTQGAGLFGYGITVPELVALDATAATTLWRAIGSFGAQVETVTAVGATGTSLPFLLPEQDIRQVEANDWMIRLVDAPGAIAARGYEPAVTAAVHLEVRDPIAPWNDGRFVLRVADGVGSLEPGGTGEVQLGVHALAAIYTGYASALDLASIGVLHGPIEPCRALDAIFAGPRPSMLEFF